MVILHCSKFSYSH